MSTIEERVARGAAFLDEKLPGWWQKEQISLNRLDLSDGCGCVVGQLYEPRAHADDTETGFEAAIDVAWLDLDYPIAVANGFYAAFHGGPAGAAAEYARLDEGVASGYHRKADSGVSGDLKERIEKMLAGLGDSADAVADSLLAKGNTGYIGDCHFCPVATFLSSEFGNDWKVGDYSVTDERTRFPGGEVANPEAVTEFIDRFDQGQYPDLREADDFEEPDE